MTIQEHYVEIGLDNIKKYNYPEIPKGDDQVTAAIRSFVLFSKEYYFIPIAPELLVCSPKDNHAGTLDCLGYVIIPNKKCINGLKLHTFMDVCKNDWRKKICETCGYKTIYKFALIDFKTSTTISGKPTYYARVSA